MGTRTVVENKHYGPLLEQLFECKADWQRIAQGLEFQSYEIDGIASDLTIVIKGPNACSGKVLSEWMNWAGGGGTIGEERT